MANNYSTSVFHPASNAHYLKDLEIVDNSMLCWNEDLQEWIQCPEDPGLPFWYKGMWYVNGHDEILSTTEGDNWTVCNNVPEEVSCNLFLDPQMNDPRNAEGHEEDKIGPRNAEGHEEDKGPNYDEVHDEDLRELQKKIRQKPQHGIPLKRFGLVSSVILSPADAIITTYSYGYAVQYVTASSTGVFYGLAFCTVRDELKMANTYSKMVFHPASNSHYIKDLESLDNSMMCCPEDSKKWIHCDEDPDIPFWYEGMWYFNGNEEILSTTEGDNWTVCHNVPDQVSNYLLLGAPFKDLVEQKKKIRQKLQDGIPLKRYNILLVGASGVGKSSLTNSMLMAINPRGYMEVAKRGSYGEGGLGGRAAITLTVEKLHLFKYIGESEEERTFHCQPYIWDFPGLPDMDDPNISKILRMVLNGEMQPGKTLTNLLEMNSQKLDKIGLKLRKEKPIQVVIFVHAVTDPIPENLMIALKDAVNPDEEGQRVVQVFGVVTKVDKIPEKKRETVVQRIVKELAANLGLEGLEERMVATSLYCNDVTLKNKRSAEIDKAICELWEIILAPDVYHQEKKKSIWRKSLRL